MHLSVATRDYRERKQPQVRNYMCTSTVVLGDNDIEGTET